MMEKLLVLVLIFSCFLRSEGALRGVHPGREKYYNPESDFTCLDGSDTIPYSLVNDDYCDCKYVFLHIPFVLLSSTTLLICFVFKGWIR